MFGGISRTIKIIKAQPVTHAENIIKLQVIPQTLMTILKECRGFRSRTNFGCEENFGRKMSSAIFIARFALF